eukprot:SAG11_NODE_1654_length_4506_cov_2.048559_2_plen_110_part_00
MSEINTLAQRTMGATVLDYETCSYCANNFSAAPNVSSFQITTPSAFAFSILKAAPGPATIRLVLAVTLPPTVVFVRTCKLITLSQRVFAEAEYLFAECAGAGAEDDGAA